jgi:hypothetical protein
MWSVFSFSDINHLLCSILIGRHDEKSISYSNICFHYHSEHFARYGGKYFVKLVSSLTCSIKISGNLRKHIKRSSQDASSEYDPREGRHAHWNHQNFVLDQPSGHLCFNDPIHALVCGWDQPGQRRAQRYGAAIQR